MLGLHPQTQQTIAETIASATRQAEHTSQHKLNTSTAAALMPSQSP
jgi:hypothetical protein